MGKPQLEGAVPVREPQRAGVHVAVRHLHAGHGPRREEAAFAAVSTPVSVPKPAAAVVADESVPKVEPSPAIPAPEQGDLLAANCPVSASHGVDATDVSRPTGQPQAD